MNKRGNGTGRVPQGQTSRGWPGAPSRNPKNNSSRRPEQQGTVPGDGGAALLNDQDSDLASDGFPASDSRNRFGRGTSASIPDPATINRGYSEVTGANVPNVSSTTSANRSLRGIDPATAPSPGSTDTSSEPVKPTFGVGTNGE